MFAPGLYAILDLDTLGDRDPRAAAEAVIRGGCVALQLRAKGRAATDLLPLAQALRRLTRAAGIPYFVNDDPRLAAQAGADGVHLGQQDGSLPDARRALGPIPAIGRSTHSLTQAVTAAHTGVAYLGFGPVFPTRTKKDADPVQGLAALRDTCAAVALPVVAIGGIRLENVGEVARAGARAAAAISAVLNAPDIAERVARFTEAFRKNHSDFK